MKKLVLRRKRGGGRKFADGRISPVKFVRIARKWFALSQSVEGFIRKTRVSRQSYYRFLNKRTNLKFEIMESRHRLDFQRKENMRQLLAWMKINPTKTSMDYYLRNIDPNLDSIIIDDQQMLKIL